MKKIIVTILMLALLIPSYSISVFAADTSAPSVSNISQMSNVSRTDEVVWYTRTYNGKQQKRLWSLTYGCWLTDWIDC